MSKCALITLLGVEGAYLPVDAKFECVFKYYAFFLIVILLACLCFWMNVVHNDHGKIQRDLWILLLKKSICTFNDESMRSDFVFL